MSFLIEACCVCHQPIDEQEAKVTVKRSDEKKARVYHMTCYCINKQKELAGILAENEADE